MWLFDQPKMTGGNISKTTHPLFLVQDRIGQAWTLLNDVGAMNYLIFYKMKKILIFILLIQFSFGLNGQNRDLFDRIKKPNLSSIELENLNYLKDLYGIEQRIVTVDESLIRLNVEILIEAFGDESTFRVDRIHSPNISNWYASLISDDGHTGGISSIDGVLFGELHDKTGSYNLSPIQTDGTDDIR